MTFDEGTTRPPNDGGGPDTAGTATTEPTTKQVNNASVLLTVPVVPPDADKLTAALTYADAGWYVLPVKRGTKSPGSVVGGQWQTKSGRNPAQIVAWFAGTDYGIALHCGRSGAVVFDVDYRDKVPEVLARHLEAGPYQSTRPDDAGRGHYVFLQPPGRSLGNANGGLGEPWGEVRGLNGVIIVAPSDHLDGGEYGWVRTGIVPVLPGEIDEQLDAASAAEDAATDEQVRAFLAEHAQADRPEILHGWIKALMDKFETGSRHTGAVSVTVGAMKEARAGYFPAQAAIDALQPMFITAATRAPTGGEKQRTEQAARDEYAGILAWSVAQANAANLDEVRARTAKKMPSNVVALAPRTNDAERQGQRTTTSDAILSGAPVSLASAHATFTKWLGEEYDTDALDAMLATAAVEKFTDGSDLVWLLLVSGPGNAKTETVQALSGTTGAVITSSLSSEAALLSATPKRERTKEATGGLLRRMGEHGVLIIKDVTSILSANRDVRARVLAALREVYDGSWYREVGTDGGQSIGWTGRIAVVGAVTTAWDAAHAVIATMGDRFVLIRIDSTTGRQAAGRKAISNTGSEKMMREELAAAVAGVLAGMNTEPVTVTEQESAVLLAAGDLVTLARTGVEYDYRGDVIDAHAPEMPTRFVKQLTQIVRGAVAVGMDRPGALRLAIRCARDSMPPLRLAIIEDLAEHPGSTASNVRRRIGKPRSTVDRQLQALHMLGVAVVEEVEYHQDRVRWLYTLNDQISPAAIPAPESSPDLSLNTPIPHRREVGKA